MTLNLKTVRVIFRKEMLDVLRDRRTLIAMLGVPILLYPLLFVVMSQVAMLEMQRVEDTPSRVAVVSDPGRIVEEWLQNSPKLNVRESADPDEELRRGQLDAIVRAGNDPKTAIDSDKTIRLTVQYDSTVSASRQTLRRIEDAIDKARNEVLDQRIAKIQVDKEFITPIEMKQKDSAPPQRVAGTILGAILPIIMVVMLGLGAFYPAIDLTAGEKERGTFETLLSAPVSTHEIVWGKFATVFCLSMATGVLNLGSMLVTFSLQLVQWREQFVKLEISFSASNIAVVFLTMVPLALFISAVMMSLAVCSRSFREAQNLVTPFFIVLLMPAAFASIPDTKLTATSQFFPIANVTLLFKQLLIEDVRLDSVFVVLISTTLYAFAALIFASWLFQREDIVLSEERAFPLTFSRTLFEPRLEPGPGLANFTLCLCFLLMFHVGGYVQSQSPYVGIIVTQWLLFGLPVIVVLLYTRTSLFYALNLRLPNGLAFVGSLIAAAAWVPILLQLSFLQNKILPIPPELAKAMEDLFVSSEARIGVPALIFMVALSPAICEELLFRGIALSAYRRRLPAWAVVLIIGTLFGAVHLTIYKFFITALSGMFLTWLVIRSRSIYCSMAAHFVVNATSILIATKTLPGFVLQRVDVGVIEKSGVPLALLVPSAIAFVAGLALIWSATGGRSPKPA
jgi:sodium transport system permease protein